MALPDAPSSKTYSTVAAELLRAQGARHAIGLRAAEAERDAITRQDETPKEKKQYRAEWRRSERKEEKHDGGMKMVGIL